jgi:hypothetical protein
MTIVEKLQLKKVCYAVQVVWPVLPDVGLLLRVLFSKVDNLIGV